MGMSVYGETGAYFQNSVWSWHPLADYVEEVAPDIAGQCRYWHSNDGDGLSTPMHSGSPISFKPKLMLAEPHATKHSIGHSGLDCPTSRAGSVRARVPGGRCQNPALATPGQMASRVTAATRQATCKHSFPNTHSVSITFVALSTFFASVAVSEFSNRARRCQAPNG
jgi:hypothetical protein